MSRSGHLIKVVPCGGKSKIMPAAKTHLSTLPTNPLDMLMICSDDDRCDTRAGCLERATQRRDALVAHAAQLRQEGVSSSLEVEIAPLTWACDSTRPGLPPQQCLERVVVGALAEVFPERVSSVAAWLHSRPQRPSEDGPKAAMWAHMAGWFAETGCDTFLERIWSLDRVAQALEKMLQDDWATIEKLVS